MPFIPFPDTAMVKAFFRTGPTNIESTFGLYFTREGYEQYHLIDLLGDLELGLITELMVPLDNDHHCYKLEAYDMRDEQGYKSWNAVDIDGSVAASSPVSPAVSCVVTFRANKRGPWNSNRVYVAGIPESMIDPDAIDGATVLAIQAAFTGLFSVPPSGWNWVVASRVYKKVPREEGYTAPVYQVEVRSAIPGFQRRRARRP